MGAVTGNSLIL